MPASASRRPRRRRGRRGAWSTTSRGRSRRWCRRWRRSSGSKLDIDRLREAVAPLAPVHASCGRRCCETAAHVPSPLTFFDGTIHMGPAVVLRGTPEARRLLRACCWPSCEQRDRRRRGARSTASGSASTGRACRSGASCASTRELFAELRACVVASTYCNSWIFDGLRRRPIRSAAWPGPTPSSSSCRSDDVQGAVHRADGARVRGRRHPLPRRQDLPEQLEQPLRHAAAARRRRPASRPWCFNGDLNDLRCFSEEQTRTNIEAFVEQLLERA